MNSRDRAYEHMDAHAQEWLEWLYDAGGDGADGYRVAQLLSLYMRGARGAEVLALASDMREDYCQYVKAQG